MALTLTRRIGETVCIGEDKNTIEMTITGVKGNQVRLAFIGDRAIPIDRKEIRQKATYTKDFNGNR